MTPRSRKLGLLFLTATALGVGPGLLLVPTLPTTVLGVPALYAWLVLWFLVEVAIVTVWLAAEEGEV